MNKVKMFASFAIILVGATAHGACLYLLAAIKVIEVLVKEDRDHARNDLLEDVMAAQFAREHGKGEEQDVAVAEAALRLYEMAFPVRYYGP